MANTTDLLNEYIVFEADQVLTNDHLNEMFNYLDNQNRLTRNKFIGIGIACGLELSSDGATNITISNGCGITSEGYSIVLENSISPVAYTAYIPYTGIAVPADLPFMNGNTLYDNILLPFYQPYCNGKNIYQLLTADEATASTNSPINLFSANSIDLTGYVVVLFLEAAETDLKNCTMQDCNNNGEKMDFTIRPLLVNRNDLPQQGTQQGNSIAATAPDIYLPRYNVPYTDLNNAADVLNGFKAIIESRSPATNVPLTEQVQAAFTWCYNTFNYLFNEAPFDFSLLQKLESSVLAGNPVQLQYVYDYLNDLVKAYYEFKDKSSCLVNTVCCPDETLFPLHLVLGEAVPNGNVYVKSLYRQNFIYSPLFAKQCCGTGELKFLFDRMRIMLSEFNIPVAFSAVVSVRSFANQAGRLLPIKITPGQYESFPLSERAIPYYYLNANNGYDIYNNWNYHKTMEGKANYNLGYNASASQVPPPPDSVINPLLYDIERYSFFRIEGHIGADYQTALTNIFGQVSNYNLPFNVVALSADMLSANAALPQCNMADLETNYKSIVNEFASRIHTIYNFMLDIPYPYADAAITSYFATFDAARTKALTMLNQVLVFNGGASYAKGNFIKTYYNPVQPNTFGGQYINTPLLDINLLLSNLNFAQASLAANASQEKVASQQTAAADKGAADVTTGSFNQFVNPVIIGNPVWFITFPYMINSFIGCVDSMMGYLTTNDITGFDTITFNNNYYTPFTGSIASFKDTLIAWMETAIASASIQGQINTLVQGNLLDEFIYEVDMLLTSFLDEKLAVLKNEYTNRLNNYQSQLNFLNYFKQHPGLEHKAGVPKGGTFVLVYHQQLPGNASTVPVFSKAGNFAINAASAEVIKEFFIKNITSINKITDADLANLFASGQAQATAPQYNLADGAVIADFYIPYLCCSDCPPVAYVLPPNPPPTIVFSIKPGKFLFDDAHNYPFTAVPPVTAANTPQAGFTSPDINNPAGLNLLTDEKNVLYLHPAMNIPQTITAIVTYKGVDAAVTIVKPDASFTLNVSASAAGLPIITVIANDQSAGADHTYQWLVNGKDISQNVPTTGIDIQLLNQDNNVIELIVSYQLNGSISKDAQSVSSKGIFKPGTYKSAPVGT